VLEGIEFFECERTDRHFVELAILLHNHGVSIRKVSLGDELVVDVRTGATGGPTFGIPRRAWSVLPTRTAFRSVLGRSLT